MVIVNTCVWIVYVLHPNGMADIIPNEAGESLKESERKEIRFSPHQIKWYNRVQRYVMGEGTVAQLQEDLDRLKDEEMLRKRAEFLKQQEDSIEGDES